MVEAERDTCDFTGADRLVAHAEDDGTDPLLFDEDLKPNPAHAAVVEALQGRRREVSGA